MFMSYEVFATFGISAILSFSLSVISLLLILAAKRGLLRVGATTKPTAYNPLLISSAQVMPKIVELTPLKDRAI